jgi:hypothetical protein
MTRAEAEKKKYDLRNMVGASYKEVIDAADAISKMKEMSLTLQTAIKEADELFLQETNVASLIANSPVQKKGRERANI